MSSGISSKDLAKVTGLEGHRLFMHQKRKADLIHMIRRHAPRAGRILDVGCAAGDVSIELAMLGYDVHGIDFEPRRLEEAKKLADRYRTAVRFSCSSFEDLKDLGRFDGVIMGEVLEHFSDPGEILAQASGLLAENGRIFITAPNMPSLRNRLKFGLLGIFPDNNPEHKYYFDHRRMSRVAAGCGVTVEFFQTRYTRVFHGPRWLMILQDLLLGWFSLAFRNSGDTLFALLSADRLLQGASRS